MGSKALEGAVGDGPAGAPQGALLAPFGVLLRGSPVHVVAIPGVHAAHVDALDGAGCSALEAGLALQRAGLVEEEDEAAAMTRRDGVLGLGVLHGHLGSEELAEGEGDALDDPQSRDPVGPHAFSSVTMRMAAAVTKRLASAAGIIHFQAKPMSWSMRTRG